MTEFLIGFLKDFFGNEIITVILLSVTPLVEAKGAIPFAFGLGMSAFSAGFYCIASATVTIPLILLLFTPVSNFLKRFSFIAKTLSAAEELIAQKAERLALRAQKKDRSRFKTRFSRKKNNSPLRSAEKNDKGGEKVIYGMLFLLSALPIPLTGIWSSSLIAVFLKLDKLRSFISIAIGNMAASVFLVALMRFFSRQAAIVPNIFIGFLIAASILFIFKSAKSIKKKKTAERKP
ncbi:MAG: small multi-drug export protein [Clostridiales bacterium]|jgi:uncharacterized membrane protein|nr:small multi-drug export protein [Clostridiales bacterium]